MKLIDVMRGAVAEVEDYARVTAATQSRAALAGSAVTDVIHLLAELIENATTFSPPFTQVRVGGELVANGFAIEIEDRGLGMTPQRLAELNERLANPPDFNPANTEQLGLFVVGQLARRHGIRVTLRPSPYGGTTAVALIPRALIVEDGPAAITRGRAGGCHSRPGATAPRPTGRGCATSSAPASAPAAPGPGPGRRRGRLRRRDDRQPRGADTATGAVSLRLPAGRGQRLAPVPRRPEPGRAASPTDASAAGRDSATRRLGHPHLRGAAAAGRRRRQARSRLAPRPAAVRARLGAGPFAPGNRRRGRRQEGTARNG